MQSAPPAALETYDIFAPYYDGFVARSDYEAFARHVEPLIRPPAADRPALLDLACGTGNSFMPFVRRGYRVAGCDISPAMVERARAKAPGAELFVADVRDLPCIERFDVVTCIDDSLNYLPGAADLAAAFHSVARNLAPAGAFLFDLNTLLEYRTTYANDYVSGANGLRFVWRGHGSAEVRSGCQASATLEIFREVGEALWERTACRHTQRHHPHEQVCELLRQAGLGRVDVRGLRQDGSLDPDADQSRHQKFVYVARRKRGGD